MGKISNKFKQIEKKYFGNFDEILNQIEGMFYANFLISLNIKNTSFENGKDGGKFTNNFLNIASKFRKTLAISIKFWIKLIRKFSKIMTTLGKFQKFAAKISESASEKL